MKTLVAGPMKTAESAEVRSVMVRNLMLAGGVLSSLLYVVMNVVAAVRYPGYDPSSQTVSELSAIGAPTRTLWVSWGVIYDLLVALFGLGVWRAATGNRYLRILGCLLTAYGVLGFFWPPMHLRGVLPSLTDALHIGWAIATVLLMVLAILYGSAALGMTFRLYSLATLAVLLTFGALTAQQSPRIPENLPTPWMGVWERINIGVFLLWIVVLAVTLMKQPAEGSVASEGRS